MSKEVVEYNVAIEARDALDQLDFTLIFNRHADGEDATNSANVVTNNSLVFLEGIGTTFGELSPLELLGRVQLVKGKDSDDYKQFKKRVWEIYQSASLAPATDSQDFDQHASVLALELIEKDCVVVTADHMDFTGLYEDEEFIQQSNDRVKKTSELLRTPTEYNFTSSTSLYKQLQVEMTDINKGTHVREVTACSIIMASADAFLKHPQMRDNMLSMKDMETGKVPTYVIYGAAHKNSLSRRLSEIGIIAPKIADLRPIPDIEYISPTPEHHRSTMNSKMAQKVFRLITINMMSLGATAEDVAKLRTIASESYGRYDNDKFEDGGEFMAFLNDSVSILKGFDRLSELTDDEFHSLADQVESLIRCYVEIEKTPPRG